MGPMCVLMLTRINISWIKHIICEIPDLIWIEIEELIIAKWIYHITHEIMVINLHH